MNCAYHCLYLLKSIKYERLAYNFQLHKVTLHMWWFKALTQRQKPTSTILFRINSKIIALCVIAAPMVNPDRCTVFHTVEVPSRKPVGFVLNRQCNYEDRCGGNGTDLKGNHHPCRVIQRPISSNPEHMSYHSNWSWICANRPLNNSSQILWGQP